MFSEIFYVVRVYNLYNLNKAPLHLLLSYFFFIVVSNVFKRKSLSRGKGNKCQEKIVFSEADKRFNDVDV